VVVDEFQAGGMALSAPGTFGECVNGQIDDAVGGGLLGAHRRLHLGGL
jgi:hypothetical protein